jgi:hypothetical protein
MADPVASMVSKQAIVTKLADLEQRFASFATLREQQEDRRNEQQEDSKYLREAVKKLQADNSSLTVRICELESWVEEKDGDQTESEGDEAEDPVGLTPEQAKAVIASREAANSNSLKACHSSCVGLGNLLSHSLVFTDLCYASDCPSPRDCDLRPSSSLYLRPGPCR